jgi:hypothetical protein
VIFVWCVVGICTVPLSNINPFGFVKKNSKLEMIGRSGGLVAEV